MIPEEVILCATDTVGTRANTILFETEELGEKNIEYAARHSTPLPTHIVEYNNLINKTRWDATMITSNYQSQFEFFIAKLHGARRVLEIGTYVGFSAMVWSHAVGVNGQVTSLELFDDMAKTARDAIDARGIKNIEIIAGDATKSISELNPSLPYDLVFIDADKHNYPNYLASLLGKSQPGAPNRLLRPGALIIADNILRWGHVADATLKTSYWPSGEHKEKEISALRSFNELAVNNDRLDTLVLPLWDGVNLIRLLD